MSYGKSILSRYWRISYGRKENLGDVECVQQRRPHSPTGDLGEMAGVNGQNSKGMCQGGKPGTGKLYTDVCFMLLRPHQWVRGRWPQGYGSALSIHIDTRPHE